MKNFTVIIIIFIFFILMIFKVGNIKEEDTMVRSSTNKEVRGIFISYIDIPYKICF